MAVNQISPAFINNELQANFTQLEQEQNRINQLYQDVVVGIGLAGLQAAPYSYSAADAQLVMNAITDMRNLFQVFQGLMYVASGATAGSGVPTANDGTHFGYPFVNNISKTGGPGY